MKFLKLLINYVFMSTMHCKSCLIECSREYAFIMNESYIIYIVISLLMLFLKFIISYIKGVFYG